MNDVATVSRTSGRSRAALPVVFAALLAACAAPSPEAHQGRVGPRVADAMLQAGDAVAALQVADGMLAANPQDIDARVRRGRALLALDRPSEAAEDLSIVARQRPDDVDTLSELARSRAAAGEPALAETGWRAVLASRPADRGARLGLAIALDLQERHAEAQALYRQVLRDRPDDFAAATDLGLSLALSGHASEGVMYLERTGAGLALPARPGGARQDVRARHDLAVALFLAGDEARARAVLGQDLGAADVAAAIDSLRALARS